MAAMKIILCVFVLYRAGKNTHKLECYKKGVNEKSKNPMTKNHCNKRIGRFLLTGRITSKIAKNGMRLK